MSKNSPALLFPVLREKHHVVINQPDGFHVRLLVPLEVHHLHGSTDKVYYDSVAEQDGTYLCRASISARNGNVYALEDRWNIDAVSRVVRFARRFTCVSASAPADVRLYSGFDCLRSDASAFSEYQFIIPGALYNRNDNDGDGLEDYLGTYAQDYRDDRNPGLSVLCYHSGRFAALMRMRAPVRDKTLTREQIRARHFVHDTDIGSLGIAPSGMYVAGVQLHMDYPFYERNSFCLNVDGSEWAAYHHMEPGDEIELEYGLLFGQADTLTDASWQATTFQMAHLLDDTVPLPFTLEDTLRERLGLIEKSYREFPDKKGNPAGYFMHFSPRKRPEDGPNILEYGFSGAQTLNAYIMLHACREQKSDSMRQQALKTIDFFVKNCIAPSGLPGGIYDIDKEDFIYWWTGVLFPFQYSRSRQELEDFLGEQVVAALMKVAEALKKTEGNYCRTMVEAMHYLLLSYMDEKQAGYDHPDWLQAVRTFGDKMLKIQNENGSWNRGYTMEGEALSDPPEWFGASVREQGSGVLFPCEVLVNLYRVTGETQYLDSARRAAQFILREYVPAAQYVGGLNDTTHIKSVKVDSVGVMFAMRSLLWVYEATHEEKFLLGARDAARILASWTFLWDVPFDETTLLGQNSFKTTGWAVCDVIPAGSYVDNEFQEFAPDCMRIAEYCRDRQLAILAKIVTRGMQHGMSMPGHMYGYSLPGVQCEGYLTALWLSDTSDRAFSGAVAKLKGDDNDTCNGLINPQAIYNLNCHQERYGTLNFDAIIDRICPSKK